MLSHSFNKRFPSVGRGLKIDDILYFTSRVSALHIHHGKERMKQIIYLILFIFVNLFYYALLQGNWDILIFK